MKWTKQISPACYERLNLYGQNRFEIGEELIRSGLHPLRELT